MYAKKILTMRSINSFKNIAFILAVFFSLSARAQLSSCNVFLKGNYIEVGINWTGAYGSSIAAPGGFHPKGPSGEGNSPVCGGACYTGGQNLGFVADPDKDGWTVGTPFPYIGDYFLPGTPQEGWAIQADTSIGWAYNGSGCGTIISANLTGANVSYSSLLNRREGIWKGNFDSIQITQRTSLDTGTVYFTVFMTLKNTGKTDRRNVYYLRTLDPDNTQPESGSFTTYNRIEFQMPNPDNKVLVSATGMKSGGVDTLTSAFLGLGTKDCRAQCFIHIGTGLYPTTSTGPVTHVPSLDSMYLEPTNGGGPVGTSLYLYKQDTTYTSDVGVSLVFKLGDIPAGDSITFAYAYILRKADIDSAFESTSPKWRGVTPSDSSEHVSGDSLNVCAGTWVPLNLINGSGFKWKWISVTGDSLTDTVGLRTRVKVNKDTTVLYAIGSTAACGADTLRIILPPFSPPPPIVTNNGPLCIGETLKLFVTGLPNAYFTWKGPNGFTDGNQNPVRNNIQPADSGLYTLLDSIPGCPPQVTSTNVLVDAVIAKIGHYKPDACVGAEFPIFFAGRAPDTNTHYKWTLDNSVPVKGGENLDTGKAYTLKWDSVGSKYITLHVQNWRCESFDSLTVPIIFAPPVHFDMPNDICVNQEARITVADYSLVGADSLAWDFGGGTQTAGGSGGSIGNVRVVYNSGGTKVVQLIVDYLLCTAAPYRDTITVHNAPDAHINDIGHDLCEGDEVTVTANLHNNYTYSWAPTRLLDTTQGKTASNFAAITIPVSRDIYLTVMDQYNCINTDTMFVNAKVCCQVSFPSAFTPNGDGRNDVFKPIRIGHHHVYHFKVLNRYGQVVFESNDETKGWDGTLFGVPQDMDTYFWMFYYDCNGRKLEEKGDVILVR